MLRQTAPPTTTPTPTTTTTPTYTALGPDCFAAGKTSIRKVPLCTDLDRSPIYTVVPAFEILLLIWGERTGI